MMRYIEYYGDDRLRHKVVYKRKSYSECIYCGKEAKSREHVPSKVFLSRPYPENLAIVPACSECNNSFSADELFLSILIEKLKSCFFGDEYVFSKEVDARINENKHLVSIIDEAIEKSHLDMFNEKISRIIAKLAVGHSVYELSEGYCIVDKIIEFSFLNNMTNEEIEEFTLPFNLNDQLLPEVGSRAFERIQFLEINLTAKHNSEQQIIVPLILLDWVDVQDNKYLYTCYRFGDETLVKMIINDFLYSKAVLKVE